MDFKNIPELYTDEINKSVISTTVKIFLHRDNKSIIPKVYEQNIR